MPAQWRALAQQQAKKKATRRSPNCLACPCSGRNTPIPSR